MSSALVLSSPEPLALPSDDEIKHANRLLPHILEEAARDDPERVAAMIAKSTDISQGFTSMTNLQYLHAVDFTARWIDSQTKQQNQVIAYIGVQDLRYLILEIAAIKTGNPLLIPSNRNALANTISLFTATDCTILFFSKPFSQLASEFAAAVPSLLICEAPAMEEMLEASLNEEPYPYNKTWDENKDETVLIVHTSGSTGRPKPISCSQYFLSGWVNVSPLTPEFPGRVSAGFKLFSKGKLLLTGSCYFHMSGVVFGLGILTQNMTVVYGPADVLATGKIQHDIMKALPIDMLVNGPSVNESLFLDYGDDLKEEFARLVNVSWMGGPLSERAGNRIIEDTNACLWQLFGSTEVGPYPLLVPPKEYWQWLEFDPRYAPKFEPLEPGSSLYEVVTDKWDDPALTWAQPVFKLFPEKTQWRTRDILQKYDGPALPNGVGPLWKFKGRIDDMLVLSNAYKVNPVHMELLLQAHPLLRGCLIFGTGRTRCGILLEGREDENIEDEELVERVWPDVEAANQTVPEHARVLRELALVVKNGRRFSRAAKGTIIRSLCMKEYEKEIDDVYERFGGRKS